MFFIVYFNQPLDNLKILKWAQNITIDGKKSNDTKERSIKFRVAWGPKLPLRNGNLGQNRTLSRENGEVVIKDIRKKREKASKPSCQGEFVKTCIMQQLSEIFFFISYFGHLTTFCSNLFYQTSLPVEIEVIFQSNYLDEKT